MRWVFNRITCDSADPNETGYTNDGAMHYCLFAK